VVNLGKFGSFLADTLVDQPYGLTYEVNNKRVNVIPPLPIQELEDTDATNELINDGQFVQPLTASEIEALKQSGVHASVTSQSQATALTGADGLVVGNHQETN
jgi:tRNA (adenine-N(1)-)-methyltransferase non-catalytic subunit